MALGASSQDSQLFYLPPEIRIQIYSLLLSSDLRIQLYEDSVDGRTRIYRFQTKLDLHPQILRSCRLIYNEALPILYTENWFHWDSVAENHPHASLINPCQYRIFKHTYCDPPSQWNHHDTQYNRMVDGLMKCPGLPRVVIHVAGLPESKGTCIWNLDELAEKLIGTGVVGDLTFRPDGWCNGRSYFNEEEKVELRKVVDRVMAAKRSGRVLASRDE